ncbi:hypothetical protein NP493_254g01011 [Ridgeia piscesae]|uniref:Uncharacterized protein n=1 Tax=Ridgeia piscesae TaxID=27915 RepID=A0AAD9NYA2_RIDPI|nr:hypothetical protein NP493_254g01011 [Ridgeia piscesae]
MFAGSESLTHCLCDSCDSCADRWSVASCRILSQDKADVTTLKYSEVDMDLPNLLMMNEDEDVPYFSGSAAGHVTRQCCGARDQAVLWVT